MNVNEKSIEGRFAYMCVSLVITTIGVILALGQFEDVCLSTIGILCLVSGMLMFGEVDNKKSVIEKYFDIK